MEAVHSNSGLLADVARYEWVPVFSMDLGVGSPRPACESLCLTQDTLTQCLAKLPHHKEIITVPVVLAGSWFMRLAAFCPP